MALPLILFQLFITAALPFLAPDAVNLLTIAFVITVIVSSGGIMQILDPAFFMKVIHRRTLGVPGILILGGGITAWIVED